MYRSLIWQVTNDVDHNTIYLTFDDGPHPDITPWVMEELDKYQAKATFFCLGSRIRENKKLAKSILDKGYAMGNHTYNHLNGWSSTDEAYRQEISECDQELREIGIYNAPFRPPYGKIKRSQIRLLEDRSLVMWSHLSWDFDPSLRVTTAIKKLKEICAGSIIVFHDSEKACSNMKRMLPELIDFYLSRGFKLENLK